MKPQKQFQCIAGIVAVFLVVVLVLFAKKSAAFEEQFPESEVLAYVAAREDVPVEDLKVAYVTQASFDLLGKDLWAVKVGNSKNEQVYGVWVDMQDGSFVDDIETIRQAEKEAYRAKYGKLDVALYEHLQEMSAEETIMVAIWVAGEATRSEEEIFAELAARYPEVKEAMERTGDPFSLDVDDYDLINEIENTYAQLRAGDIPSRIQPLVDYLEEQGCAVQTFDLLPAVMASLPKEVIIEVALRSEVGSIDRADQPVETQHVPTVP